MNKFNLIQLPFASNALEPVMSAETIEFHHGKHLQTYVNNLNAAIEGTAFAELSLEEIVKRSEGGMFNNAGQILNHNLYFTQFKSASEENLPAGKIAEALVRDFGSFEAFKDEFTKKSVTLFGSGWAWLSADAEGKLHITQEANGGNPLRSFGFKPLLGFDVWEHAYYIDYRNRRADHVAALWKIIDWQEVDRRYSK